MCYVPVFNSYVTNFFSHNVEMNNKGILLLLLIILVFYPCYARASRRCQCQAGPKSTTATLNGLNQRAVENLRPLF